MEEWKTIIQFPNYKVSNYGNILSINYRNTNKPKIMSINIINDYPQINFRNDKLKKSIKIHRLVAQYFISNPNNYPCVNHIDGNKTNNNISNLEWCTYSHNLKHSFKIGLSFISETTKLKLKELHALKVIDTKTNIIYNSIGDAAKVFNLNRRTLNDYLLGRRTNKTTLKFK